MFGPYPLPLPLKLKRTKTPRKKVKSRAKAEKTRVSKRPEKQKEESRRRAERLLRRANKREEEKKSRAERGEPEVLKAKKSTRKSSHGTEEVDAIILKVLGRSHNSKKAESKSKGKKAKKEKVAEPKWRHGMREERHEDRTGKVQKKKLSRKLKAIQVFLCADNLDNTKTAEGKQSKAEACQVLPIVDVGTDYEADGGLFDLGDGAAALAWPLGPENALPSSGEEAAALVSPLPAQTPLDPEAFCMEFYQVGKKTILYH